jgi:hypothetical protein
MAFSSEPASGSREENRSKQKLEPPFQSNQRLQLESGFADPAIRPLPMAKQSAK